MGSGPTRNRTRIQHVSLVPDPDNRRQFQRVRVDAAVRLYSDREMWASTLVDIALKGALVERPREWQGEVGKTQRLELRVNPLVIVSANARVAHVGENFIGFCFQRMDLASFMSLKRLRELYLGDPELLNRELAALDR